MDEENDGYVQPVEEDVFLDPDDNNQFGPSFFFLL